MGQTAEPADEGPLIRRAFRPLSTGALISLIILAVACNSGPSDEPTGKIAFVTDRDGNQEIYVMNANGTGLTNITNDPAEDREPAWSPDSSQLAFGSSRSGAIDIYVMEADGSDVRQITDSPAVDGGPKWAPDSSRLALYSFINQRQGLLWVINLDGTEMTPVLVSVGGQPATSCAGGFPGSWFPDGQRLLFRGSSGNLHALQICTVALDGSPPEILFSESDTLSHFPVLSPDSTKIAFTFEREENPEIYTINVDGGGLKRITNNEAVDQNPTWSPDGRWIAFESNRDGDLNIYIVRADGSDLRRLTDNDAADRQPAWSPPSSDAAQ